MLIYLIIIVFLFISLFFNIDKNPKDKKNWLIVTFLVLTIISALRAYSVGGDTLQYYNAFQKMTAITWDQPDLVRYEPGYFFLNKLITLFTSDSQIYLAIISAIIIPAVGCFIYKYSKNVVFSTLLYFLFNIYFFQITGLRQSLAIIVLLFSIPLLRDKKYLKFAICVIFSALFHSTSIIFLICIPLEKIKYTKYTYIYTLAISFICFILSKPLFVILAKLFGKYSTYVYNEAFGVSNYFGALFLFMTTLVVYLFCHFLYIKYQNTKKKEDKSYLLNTLLLKVLAVDVIVQCMGMKMNIIGRMNQYFWIYSIILIPNLLDEVKDKKMKKYLTIGTLVFALGFWLIIAIFRPEWNSAIPYSIFTTNT